MLIKAEDLSLLGKAVETQNNNGDKIVLLIASSEAIGAVFEVMAQISSLLKKRESERAELEWREEISNKLTMILALTEEILSELRKLRLYMDEAIEKGFRRDVEIELNALCRQYFDIVNKKKYKEIEKDKNLKEIISDLAIKLHHLNYKLMGYGFAGFTVVAAAISTYLSMQIYLKSINENFLTNVINWFFSGGDQKYPGSFAYIRDILNNEALQVKNNISIFPPRGLIGYDTYYTSDDINIYSRNSNFSHSHFVRPSHKIYFYDVYEGTVNGDLNSGFSVITNKIDDTFISNNPNNLPSFPGFPPLTELDSTRKYNAYANEIGKWLNDQSIAYREKMEEAARLNSYSELSIKIGVELKEMTKKH